MAKIVFREITKKFPGASKPAVDAVSFEVQEGNTCMLVGTSGSGKTTLLRMVNPTASSIVALGVRRPSRVARPLSTAGGIACVRSFGASGEANAGVAKCGCHSKEATE